jgi:hypothetical protein
MLLRVRSRRRYLPSARFSFPPDSYCMAIPGGRAGPDSNAGLNSLSGIAYGRASYTTLNGVSAARRKRLNPAAVTTSRIRFSPDCAPKHNATSCEREQGVHNRIEKE